ncbi:MAG: YbaB/EbfC family nucleoid-associated protein [Chitinophagales bacterium]
MDFGSMFGKIQEAQQKMEAVKAQLKTIHVQGDAENKQVVATFSAAKEMINIQIADELIQEGDREQIEDLVTIAVNRALEKADEVAEVETKKATDGLLPNIPGLGL